MKIISNISVIKKFTLLQILHHITSKYKFTFNNYSYYSIENDNGPIPLYIIIIMIMLCPFNTTYTLLISNPIRKFAIQFLELITTLQLLQFNNSPYQPFTRNKYIVLISTSIIYINNYLNSNIQK